MTKIKELIEIPERVQKGDYVLRLVEDILGGYVDFIRSKYPNAPTPPVYVSAAIIAQAEAERANYGDELFFKRSSLSGSADPNRQLCGSATRSAGTDRRPRTGS